MGFLCLPGGEKVGTSIRNIILVVPGQKPTDDEPPSRYASLEGPKLLPAISRSCGATPGATGSRWNDDFRCEKCPWIKAFREG